MRRRENGKSLRYFCKICKEKDKHVNKKDKNREKKKKDKNRGGKKKKNFIVERKNYDFKEKE